MIIPDPVAPKGETSNHLCPATAVDTLNTDLQVTHKKQPVFHLYSAPVILEMPLGKDKRSALHDIVHAFRAAHGFEKRAEEKGHAAYEQAVCKYSCLEPYIPLTPQTKKLISAIEQLSTPEVYAEIRQAGRARISNPPLPLSLIHI